MIEWLDSIWEWILENRDDIMAFFTSTDFVATVTSFVALIRTIKTTKANTLSVNSVNNTMKQNQIIQGDVENVKEVVANTQAQVIEVTNSVNDCIHRVDSLLEIVKQYDDELLVKLNAMLEVQTIVYATVKDDNIRNAVNSILVAAKHSDNASKIKLQEELDALRLELKAKNDELAEAVSKMVEKVAVDVTATTPVPVGKSKKTITRY